MSQGLHTRTTLRDLNIGTRYHGDFGGQLRAVRQLPRYAQLARDDSKPLRCRAIERLRQFFREIFI